MVRDTVTISSIFSVCYELTVAPSRGRGLKQNHFVCSRRYKRRPFTGAWIETPLLNLRRQYQWSPLHGGVD